jgi:hypothetical protein
VTKVPPSARNSVANFMDWRTSSAWENASCTQAVPTLGAPSCKTVSAFRCLRCFRRVARQESVVISLWKLMHRGMAFIGARSQPTMSEPAGHTSEATCIHDPGAAHRSMTTLDFSRKLYFLLSCMSLKAALARYPFSLARRYHLSRRPVGVSACAEANPRVVTFSVFLLDRHCCGSAASCGGVSSVSWCRLVSQNNSAPAHRLR